MPVPTGVDLVTAAALPEVACTVWSNVFMMGGLQPDETFLVHGGAGGIGTFAIQLVAQLGSRVFTTGGTPEKLAACAELGADVTINYRDQDFVEVVREQTDGAGVDVILDNMGAKYLGRNVEALATEGRLLIIGMQGGTKGELDISALFRKRGAVIAALLRSRPVEQKAAICASVVEHVWPLVADGRVRPIVHGSMPLDGDRGGAPVDGGRRAHRQDRAHPVTVRVEPMSEQSGQPEEQEQRVVVIGPDGQPMGSVPASALEVPESDSDGDDDERSITELVEQPAKVMRIGSMIRQLLEEVKAAPLDEASRNRLKEIHQASIKELEAGLAPELVEELERLSLPVHRGHDALRQRAADRPGAAGRLAGGPVPRHPDRDLRPADGGAGAVRADPEGAAAGDDAAAGRSAAAAARRGRRPAARPELGRDVPLGRRPRRIGGRAGVRRPGRAARSAPAPARARRCG